MSDDGFPSNYPVYPTTTGTTGTVTINLHELWLWHWGETWRDVGEAAKRTASGWYPDQHEEHKAAFLFWTQKSSPSIVCVCFDCRALRAWRTK